MGRRRRAANLLQSSFISLTDDLCEHIFRFTAAGIDIISDLRTVAPWWSALAARLVKRLAARGCLLPSKAWTVFPNATGLVILIEGVPGDEISPRLRQLAETLPETVEHLSMPKPGYHTPSAYCSNFGSFGQQLASSACALSLKVVTIDAFIPPAAADALLRGLPCLQQTKLNVGNASWAAAAGNQQQYTLSHFPPALQDIQLHAHNKHFGDNVQLYVDAAALAACSNLQHVRLTLSGSYLLNPTSISRCKALNTLELCCFIRDHALFGTIIAAASKLQQLQALKLNRGDIHSSSKEWQQLTALPSFHTLHVESLIIDTTDAPAPHITHLSAEVLQLAPELLAADSPAGSLAQLLPAAEELHIGPISSSIDLGAVVSIAWLLHLLQGAHQLQVLIARDSWSMTTLISRPFQQHYLSSFPKLRKASFVYVNHTPAADIMRAAAQCPTLQELVMLFDKRLTSDMAAGLHALAAGACRQTLQKIELALASVAQLAVLLDGGMPALQKVSAHVYWPRDNAQVLDVSSRSAEIVQEVQQQLEEAGVKGLVGFGVVQGGEGIRLAHQTDMEGRVGSCQLRLTVRTSHL